MGVSAIHGVIRAALDLIAQKRNAVNDELLEVVTKLEKMLHPNNYLILGVKEIIIQRLMKSISISKRKGAIEGNLHNRN